MNDCRASTIEAAGKRLIILTANVHDGSEINDVDAIAQPLFAEIAPFLKNQTHVLYVRDLPEATIDGIYPKGHVNHEEIYIAVPSWPADTAQLTHTLAHEFHKLAHMHMVHMASTLGAAITSEGMSWYYATLRSNWRAPWTQTVLSEEIIGRIRAEWDSELFNRSDLFYKGTLGQWIGYSVGYYLAEHVFKNEFDIRLSLVIPADALKTSLDEQWFSETAGKDGGSSPRI